MDYRKSIITSRQYTHLFLVSVNHFTNIKLNLRTKLSYLLILRIKAHWMTQGKIIKPILRFIKFGTDHKHPCCM